MARPKKKMERVPVSGLRDIMTVDGKDENYSYRWVVDTNDNGSKILKYKRGGWEFARAEGDNKDVTVGEESVYRSDIQGSIVRLMTGNNEYSYLMRIHKEYYNEDQKAKSDAIDEQESAIKRTGSASGDNFDQYGKISITGMGS